MMWRLKAILLLLVLCSALTVSAQDETVHVVLPGENLFRIAQQYGIDVDSIARANEITNTWHIYAGQRLIVPPAVSELPAEILPFDEAPLIVEPFTPAEPTILTHVILPNETLNMIAGNYGMTVEALIDLNGITNPNWIYAGQELRVYGSTADTPVEAPPSSEDVSQPLPSTIQHIVTPGERLNGIANRYGMAVETLADLNGITNPNLIYVGQVLQVYGTPAEAPAAVEVVSQPQNNAPATHIVQRGETLAVIGQRYGVSWLQIAQANNIYNADHVEVGAELLIPGGSLSESAAPPPAAPPARIGTGKEIIVDLSDSRVYAYEDGVLVRNVVSSNGLPATPTVQGSFTIQRKYVAQTMTGPGYYLPDVPYVMYFYAGYALHGTYWHNNFGQPMSHGCVNLPTPEAGWFYDWTEIGTPIYVQP